LRQYSSSSEYKVIRFQGCEGIYFDACNSVGWSQPIWSGSAAWQNLLGQEFGFQGVRSYMEKPGRVFFSKEVLAPQLSLYENI